jgi:zinc protease
MPATPVSDLTFGREVLTAAMPVLVEFSAAHSPSVAVLEELSCALEGRVKIVKVDVDRNPSLREDHAVRGLPALILFKHGKAIARRLGGRVSKAELDEWIDGALILALATHKSCAGKSVTDFKLANGLHVVVIPDHRVPVVTHLTWYKVGAADEPKDFSGLAQLVAQLSMKSLNSIADGDYSRAIARLGGTMNLHCRRFATTYWQRIPKEALRLVMAQEADRMATLRVTDEEMATERMAMREQRGESVDIERYAHLTEKMHEALYRAHTFRLQSQGLAEEVARLSREDVLRFHQHYYAPNNAIVVVAGDVTPEDVKLLAVETFGRIAANPAFDLDFGRRESIKTAVQPIVARVTLDDVRLEAPYFRRIYAVPGYGSAGAGETEALQVLAQILIPGAASRLHRKLVIDEGLATSIEGSFVSIGREASEIALSVVAKDRDLRAVEAAVNAAVDDIREHGVSQAELRCAKKSLIAYRIYRGGNQLELARSHARAAALGRTLADVEDWPAAISRVTADEVWKAARTHLLARRAVSGWLSAPSKRVRRAAPSAAERRSG